MQQHRNKGKNLLIHGRPQIGKKNKNKNKTREYSLQRKGKKNLYIYINSENCPAEERENKKKLTPSIESFAQFCHKIS